ncbi:MAG: tRNA (guanosine(46)-N7)-methyltransferase TrmB [Bacilli bacterium]|jgi:tRNA (guanine-N7-)-methyltransferase|nr:tRNA (guanosine(46)-N7)-methyltransferase TrmB [Bacilli bacterium]
MRLRNIKNANKIIEHSSYVIINPTKHKGKWHQVFNNNNPIYIEIGMGKGKFIIANALKYPNINFIGIEKYASVLTKAINKLNDYDISNLRIICLDAINIDEIFKQEINRIYLNFSDPWPKKRHSKRRLTSLNFLNKYELVFKSTKEIFLKTDNKEFFLFSLESLRSLNYQVKNICFDLKKTNNKDNITTEYEEKFMDLNKNIYCLEAYKN